MTGDLRPAVLVVDDDRQDRRLLTRVLEREGYRTAAAADASEARAALDASSFDLVVSDLRMPGESGHELVEHVLRTARDTAVLVVSGCAERAAADRLAARGAHGYLVKPFANEQFLISVRDALHRHRLEREQLLFRRRLEREVELRTSELRRSRRETLGRLLAAAASRDDDTGSHSERVGRLARRLAEALGLDAGACDLISLASPLHDVGKIAVPDDVLRKRGPLTPHERRLMETHTTVGHRLLSGSGDELLELAASIAWTHHERLDGSGYPRGLEGDAVPLAGRIVAVADVADALTSDRPYRRAYAPEQAAEILLRLRGRQLDGEIVDALLAAGGLPTLGPLRQAEVA